MRVRLQPDLCTGHGRCYALAPEVFDADDRGLCVIPDDAVPAGFEPKVRTAVANCPEGALATEE